MEPLVGALALVEEAVQRQERLGFVRPVVQVAGEGRCRTWGPPGRANLDRGQVARKHRRIWRLAKAATRRTGMVLFQT